MSTYISSEISDIINNKLVYMEFINIFSYFQKCSLSAKKNYNLPKYIPIKFVFLKYLFGYLLDSFQKIFLAIYFSLRLSISLGEL